MILMTGVYDVLTIRHEVQNMFTDICINELTYMIHIVCKSVSLITHIHFHNLIIFGVDFQGLDSLGEQM